MRVGGQTPTGLSTWDYIRECLEFGVCDCECEVLSIKESIESDEEVSFNLQRYTAPITMEVPPRSSPSSLSGLDLNEDEGERNQRDRRDSAERSELSLLSESDDDEEGIVPKPHAKTEWVAIRSSRLREQYRRVAAAMLQESLEAPSLPPETAVTSDWLCERLEALGRNPQAVEVGLDPSGNMYLQDGQGPFLYHVAGRREEEGASPSLTARVLPKTPGEVDALREEVRALRKEIKRLGTRLRDAMKVAEAKSAKELGRLKKENARLKARCDELQLRRCEENLRNEAEVDALRKRLQKCESPPTGGEGGALMVRTPTPTSASPRRKEKVIAPRRKSVSVTVKEEPLTVDSTSSACASPALRGQEVPRKRGKAPPIEYFSAENPEILLDDWLPTVERAAKWNGWNEEEHLMQLEGHLKGKALQEWTLMSREERSDIGVGTAKLRERIDPVNPFVAVQEFRHLMQAKTETVSDYIRHVERAYRIAHRKEVQPETREALLFMQMREGLREEIIRAPQVSGCQRYSELCQAAKFEEKRLVEIRKRRQYRREVDATVQSEQSSEGSFRPQAPRKPIKCYGCGDEGHISRDCPNRGRESESSGRSASQASTKKKAGTRQVTAESATARLDALFPTDAEVRTIRVADKGSSSQCARVQIQGVPAYGIIDTGSDLTIIGGELFKRVAAAAKLRRRDCRAPDKVPRTYAQQEFRLDGLMDLEIEFDGKSLITPVYIKVDAHDQLLLSEGVCSQLGIVRYHSDVRTWQKRKERKPAKKQAGGQDQRQETETVAPEAAPNVRSAEENPDQEKQGKTKAKKTDQAVVRLLTAAQNLRSRGKRRGRNATCTKSYRGIPRYLQSRRGRTRGNGLDRNDD